MEQCDLKNIDDVQYVSEVAHNCTNHMMSTETILLPKTTCTSQN